MRDIFLKPMFNILKIYMSSITIFHFYQKKGKLRKLKNLHVNKEYVIHIRNLKQALNHALVLKKVHRVIKFNQKAWLNPYMDMKTRKRGKMIFKEISN